jgi:hypothetical protein
MTGQANIKIKDEEGGLFTDCHSIVARWRNHFSELLNAHGVNDVRQKEPSEPLLRFKWI